MKKFAFVLSTILIFCIYGCNKSKKDIVFLVEETNYFHKTDGDLGCKYLRQAKMKAYRTKEIHLSVAYFSGYKMCTYCFSPSEVDEYSKKAREYEERRKMDEYEEKRKEEILNSIDDETKQLIIDEWIEEQQAEEETFHDSYPDDVPHGRYY